MHHHAAGIGVVANLASRAAVACSSSDARAAYSFAGASARRGRRATGGGRQQQQQQQHWSDREPSAPRRRPPQTRGSSRVDEQPQRAHRYLVTCHPGLEGVTAAELQSLNETAGIAAVVEVTAPGRVSMGSDSLAAGYAAAVCLRSATRVLQLVDEQQLDPAQPAGQTVYDATRQTDWAQLLRPQQTLGVHCLHFYGNSNVTNSQLVQRRVRDAVCDAVRDARGVRPAPPEGAPDLPLVFQMLADRLQLFRDVGGGSLHRRGYRTGAAVHKAALNEAAAAGLLLIAGWQSACQQEGATLVDPMCGSGTLLIEGALLATNTAPGLLRDTAASPWPVQGWPDYEQRAWSDVVAAAQQRSQEGTAAWRQRHGCLLGNDSHAGALKLAAQSLQAAGVARLVQLHQGLCGEWQLPTPKQQQGPLMVVANPPWGLRLLSDGRGARDTFSSSRGGQRGYQQQQQQQQQPPGDDEGDLVDTWQQVAYFLKQHCPGAEAWLLSGNPEAFHHLGMSSRRKRSVSIGGQRTTWAKYEVWGGAGAGGRGGGRSSSEDGC